MWCAFNFSYFKFFCTVVFTIVGEVSVWNMFVVFFFFLPVARVSIYNHYLHSLFMNAVYFKYLCFTLIVWNLLNAPPCNREYQPNGEREQFQRMNLFCFHFLYKTKEKKKMKKKNRERKWFEIVTMNMLNVYHLRLSDLEDKYHDIKTF